MHTQILTDFFMWCTIINAALLLFWTVMLIAVPDLLYRTQSKFVPISREAFVLAMYCFLGAFKLGFIFFNLVPYIALLIVG